MKIAIGILLALVSSPAWSAEGVSGPEFSFPQSPPSFRACYRAGQDWIRARMWDPAAIKKFASFNYEFNDALARCTWRVPQAKNFKWPKGYEPQPVSDRLSFLAQAPNGDWVVGIYYTSTHDKDVHIIKISSRDSSVQALISEQMNSAFFFGYDFAPYHLNAKTRAFGIQTATFLKSWGYQLKLILVGYEDGEHVYYLQGIREAVYASSPSALTHKKCTDVLAPDPANDHLKIIETCRLRTADSALALKDEKSGKVSSLPLRVLRWNGHGYAEGDPKEWLAKLHRPKTKVRLPKILTHRTASAVQALGPLQIKTISETQAPQGREVISERQWFEVVQGAKTPLLVKINSSLRASAGSGEDYIEPEVTETDDGKSEVRYGRYSATVKPESVYRGVLTVFVSNGNCAPMQRCYDDGLYRSYDLESGEQIDWAKSFKSEQSMELFRFWLWGRFADKIDYSFPPQVRLMGVGDGVWAQEASFLLRPEGLELVLSSSLGGHYFEESVGKVPYATIPAEWFAKGGIWGRILDLSKAPPAPPAGQLLRPDLKCSQTSTLSDTEKKICQAGQGRAYEQFLQLLQARIETHPKEDPVYDDAGKQLEILVSGLENGCPQGEASCIAKRISDGIEQLKAEDK